MIKHVMGLLRLCLCTFSNITEQKYNTAVSSLSLQRSLEDEIGIIKQVYMSYANCAQRMSLCGIE